MPSNPQLTPLQLLDNLLQTTVSDLVAASTDAGATQILAMLKVADLQSELCKGPFAGLKKQSAGPADNMTRALGFLLPQMVAAINPTAVVMMPTERAQFEAARDSLGHVGDLISFRDMAKAAEYGLTKSRLLGPTEVELIAEAADEEAVEHADRNALLDGLHDDRAEARKTLVQRTNRLRGYNQLRGYAGTQAQFNAYVELGRGWLEFFMPEYAEADAYAGTTLIGPLTFAQWKGIVVNVCAMGFACAEQEDAARHMRGWNTPGHFLSMPPSRISAEQLRTCFAVAGIPDQEQLYNQIAECLILDAGNAGADYGADGAVPILMRIGTDVFMPRYARNSNPYMFLVSRLAKVYARDAKRMSQEREPQFVADLQTLLGGDRYTFGKERVDIFVKKVPLTDIDAVVYEKHTSSLYLIQLKWFAVHAHDLERREEQYDELCKVGKWINKVQGWVDRMPRQTILAHVGLGDAGIDPDMINIRLVVLNRWWTRYSGKPAFPDGAVWMSWSRLGWLMRCARDHVSPFGVAWEEAKVLQPGLHKTRKRFRRKFPGLTVWIER